MKRGLNLERELVNNEDAESIAICSLACLSGRVVTLPPSVSLLRPKCPIKSEERGVSEARTGIADPKYLSARLCQIRLPHFVGTRPLALLTPPPACLQKLPRMISSTVLSPIEHVSRRQLQRTVWVAGRCQSLCRAAHVESAERWAEVFNGEAFSEF